MACFHTLTRYDPWLCKEGSMHIIFYIQIYILGVCYEPQTSDPGLEGVTGLTSEPQVISHLNKPRLSGMDRGLGLGLGNRKIEHQEVECDQIVGFSAIRDEIRDSYLATRLSDSGDGKFFYPWIV